MFDKISGELVMELAKLISAVIIIVILIICIRPNRQKNYHKEDIKGLVDERLKEYGLIEDTN